MTEISGLPAHVLLVHAVVVLVPLTALALLLATFWPDARGRLGVVAPLLGLATLVVVPVTTSAGEWLEQRVPDTELVRRHTHLGDTLLPWVVGLFALTLAVWWLDGASGRRRRRGLGRYGLEERTTRIVLGALALVVAVGALVAVYRIGDSGARAVWDGRVQATDGG